MTATARQQERAYNETDEEEEGVRNDDEKVAEAAQRIAASVRRANATTAQQTALKLSEVLRVLNENPSDLYVLARAHGRKFPGDRGYQWYHFRRWLRGTERWPW